MGLYTAATFLTLHSYNPSPRLRRSNFCVVCNISLFSVVATQRRQQQDKHNEFRDFSRAAAIGIT